MRRSPFDPPFSGPEALRAALRWGHEFAGWEISGLLQDLDRQREHIETIITGENPRVAADWLFRMVDDCRRRLVQVRDDGELVCWWEEELVVAWIRARQRLRASSHETVALLLEQLRLLSEESSVAECWIEALNPAGLRALEAELLRRVDTEGRGEVHDLHWRTIDEIRERLRKLRSPKWKDA
jgi:hypothetical protein